MSRISARLLTAIAIAGALIWLGVLGHNMVQQIVEYKRINAYVGVIGGGLRDYRRKTGGFPDRLEALDKGADKTLGSFLHSLTNLYIVSYKPPEADAPANTPVLVLSSRHYVAAVDRDLRVYVVRKAPNKKEM